MSVIFNVLSMNVVLKMYDNQQHVNTDHFSSIRAVNKLHLKPC